MSLVIETRNDLPHYSFDTTLDGETFTLTFRWNAVDTYWYLSVKDAGGNDILTSRRVVVDWPIGYTFRNRGMPAGALIFVDTQGEQHDPGLEDLGGRVQLYYFTAAELA